MESRGFQPGPCRTGFKAAICVCKRDLSHSICQSKAELRSSVWTPHPVLPTRWLVRTRCSWQGPFSSPGQWPKRWENKQRVNDFVFTLPAFRCQHLNLILGFLPRRYGSVTQAYSTPLSTPSDWTCFLSQKFCNGCWKRQLCRSTVCAGRASSHRHPAASPGGLQGRCPSTVSPGHGRVSLLRSSGPARSVCEWGQGGARSGTRRMFSLAEDFQHVSLGDRALLASQASQTDNGAL